MPTSSDTSASNPARELAAIMFSDLVGYTTIMGRDEQQGLRALEDHRELLRLLPPKFNGRMMGEIGDGTLTSFHSAIDAVNCSREEQASLQQDQPDLKGRISMQAARGTRVLKRGLSPQSVSKTVSEIRAACGH